MRKVLQPALYDRHVFLEPRLIPTSPKGRGGGLRFDRVKLYIRNTLRERKDTYVTTFFDLYGLEDNFPGVSSGRHLADPIQRARLIEKGFHDLSAKESGVRADRFFPHIQPFEFEALLFSDLERLCALDSRWKSYLPQLEKIRNSAFGPEYINDGPSSHPSARLVALPGYRKVRHGAEVAQLVGLDAIRFECRHFGSWMSRLEGLQPLKAGL